MDNATNTYRVEITSMRFTVSGLVPVWISATPHVYKRRAAAQRLADRLRVEMGGATRVVAS